MEERQLGGCCPAVDASTPDAVALAPIVNIEAAEPIQMRDIDAGPIDYAIRCTRGRFAGRFMYVNRAPGGEVLGSDPDCKEVTMCISNADLSPIHAALWLDLKRYQYFLCDMESATGTWVAMRWNRSIEVSTGQEIMVGTTIIEIVQGPIIGDDTELRRWLSAHQLPHLAPKLEELGLRSLEDAHRYCDQLVDMVADSIQEAGDQANLSTAIGELRRMCPSSGAPENTLRFVVRHPDGGGHEGICEISRSGGTIELKPRDGEAEAEAEERGGDEAAAHEGGVHGAVLVDGLERRCYLRVGYSFGRYHVYLVVESEYLEQPHPCWVRLRPGQKHWLQPMDTFKIGALEFNVLRFNCGVHSDQGRRPTMEDKEIVLQDLAISNWRYCSFFAIYDGHGGPDCVEFVRRNLHMNFVETVNATGGLDNCKHVFRDIHGGLHRSFTETDRRFASLVPNVVSSSECGSAAVVACVLGAWVWCANCGDSRAILCRSGAALQLSCDHKPDREDERRRIEDAGAFVSWGRVNGRLALSRAFGDVDCKMQVSKRGEVPVTAEPEIRAAKLTPEDEFLLLACDGIFDVFSSQEAIGFVRSKLASMPPMEQDPNVAAKALVDEAISERCTRDNVTAMIVTFKRHIKPAAGGQ